VDSEYVEGSAVKEIAFNSDDYFELISDKPGLVRYLSVARDLIISYEGVNYKVVDINEEEDPADIPLSRTKGKALSGFFHP
jgi:hypothetical protein